ncbi:hypothetical protein [Pseudonocardia sp. TRM90224]|uniref:hypothetical protein n=1 Tax=Pseudonocardia sp. TRM90224 TaxID=2812678 RepID=UPI001E2EC999|nr:hypothetical protein [Pseudonocardia sp. TRM90224]
MGPYIRNRRLSAMACVAAAAGTVILATPTAASAAVPAPVSAATAVSSEAGCVGASRRMEPNGADAICIQGADYITVHITCVMVTTATYYDRSGPRVWSNNGSDGSRVYCDFPGDPILEHSFSVG